TRLAVAGVSAAATAAVPRPPLVTVVPWTQLAAWAAAVLVMLVVAGWLARSGTAGQERTRRVRQRRRSGAREATEGVARGRPWRPCFATSSACTARTSETPP